MLETKWPSHRLYSTIPSPLAEATKLVDRIWRKKWIL
jgi:hypothetical protein